MSNYPGCMLDSDSQGSAIICLADTGLIFIYDGFLVEDVSRFFYEYWRLGRSRFFYEYWRLGR